MSFTTSQSGAIGMFQEPMLLPNGCVALGIKPNGEMLYTSLNGSSMSSPTQSWASVSRVLSHETYYVPPPTPARRVYEYAPNPNAALMKDENFNKKVHDIIMPRLAKYNHNHSLKYYKYTKAILYARHNSLDSLTFVNVDTL
jgi:hypothetical protein